LLKVFRFEELKDPGDSCVLYVIKGNDSAMGYILDAYGVYSNYDEEGFLNAMRMMPKKIITSNYCLSCSTIFAWELIMFQPNS